MCLLSILTSKTFTITPSSGYEIGSVTVNGTNVGKVASYTFNNVTSNQTITASYEKSLTEFNTPVLTIGLIPVNWSGSAFVTTTVANWDYNYDSVATATHSSVAGNGAGKWANAQTSNGSQYVWIPRYSYKITSGEHSTGNSWNSLETPGSNKIEIKWSNGTVDDTSDGYIEHPAFNFGGTQLDGIWVAKYEASRNDATASSAGSGTTATSRPGVISWRSLTISQMYDYAKSAFSAGDSHMMKNSEWGAVAYLTNAIGRIPYKNNSSSYITGNAGGSQDASEASGVTNAWNSVGGVKASTTHNVYGIYDMSGGTWEHVAAYVNNGNSSLTTYGSSLVNGAAKYKDVYPMGSTDTQANNYAAWSNINGDAVYETSNGYNNSASWDGNRSLALHSTSPFFYRGGVYNGSAGVFSFGDSTGSVIFIGFRTVLAIQ